MRETELISSIRALASRKHTPQLIKGIGDDCAIFRPRPDEDLVFTADFLLEDRHFERTTHRASDIGHKALARSLSDLAAMGSEPVFCLVSLAVPANVGTRWIDAFYRGLLALAERYKIVLAGGDLARFERTAVDVMCCGRVPQGKALLRSAARAGDRIFVTGELGGAALGFVTQRGAAWRRHLRPEPRVEEGLELRRRGVRSCIDLSDGLSLDLHRLCLESKVSAELGDALPVARGATLPQALHGGEDYELLFTAPPKARVPASISGVRITSIGEIVRDPKHRIFLTDSHGQRKLVTPAGWEHFAP